MGGFLTVGYFIFTLFFSLLAFVLWARIAFRYYRISAVHPVGQAIYKLTNPLVTPIARLLSSNKPPAGRYDWPCFAVLVLVELIKFSAIKILFLGAILSWSFIPLYTLADLIIQPCNLLFYAFLIRIIMSWVNPNWHTPIAEVLYRMTEPLLRWGRRFIPVMGGLDFSPLVIIILLKIITLFISASLPYPLI
jgi:YggT family protein